MRAIQIKHFGGLDELQLVDLPYPQLADGEVLLKMRAAAVNPLDNVIRLGRFPLGQRQPPLVPGIEGMGEIVEGGSSGFMPGNRVVVKGDYGIRRDGTWQEYLLARPKDLALIPPQLGNIEAAALPTAYLAAYLALTVCGQFQPGQKVFITGVSGSVGNAAVQLATSLKAQQVITTARTTERATKAQQLGYNDIIDLSQETVLDGIKRLTSGQGVDLVIDSLGGQITAEAALSLKRGGCLVILGQMAGDYSNINVTDIFSGSKRIVGYNTISQPPENILKAYSEILELVCEGKIKPLIDRHFPLEEAQEAQRYLNEKQPFGKVVLVI